MSLYKNFTGDTLAQVQALTSGDAFKAGISTSTGLTAYNLEATAKILVPLFSPLRKEIPRVTPPGNLAGLAPHWKQLTSFNSQTIRPYVSEGKRGSTITYTEADKTAPYVTLGLENNATFEAESAAIGFDNVDDLATLGLLNQFFSEEEKVIIGGNGSANAGSALGQTGTPVVTVEASGGSLTASTTYYVGVVALTYDGWLFATQQGSVPQSVSQANAGPAGGSTAFNGGSAIISPVANGGATSGGSNSIVATVAALKGAVGYAWFVSTDASTTSHQYLYAVTTINSVNITGPGVNTAQDFALLNSTNDYSQNALSYDGIISQTFQGGYYYQMPTGTVGVGGAGTGLTPTVTGSGVGIQEINTALNYFWTNFNSGIDEILVNSQELVNITNKILAVQGASALIRFNYSPEQIMAGTIVGGAVVGSYLNPFAMNGPVMIPIKLHPYIPAGTIVLRPIKVPYQITNVGTILRINARKDYYQLVWPLTQRQREWGQYNETVLQNYAPFMFGLITNIANK